MTNETMKDGERAAFEAHMRAKGATDFGLERWVRHPEEYSDQVVQACWQGWRDRAASHTTVKIDPMAVIRLKALCNDLGITSYDEEFLSDPEALFVVAGDLRRKLAAARAAAPQAALTEEQRDRLTLIADSLSRSTSAKDRAAAEGLRALLIQAPTERMSDAEDAARYRWLRRQAVAVKHYASGNPNWEIDWALRGETFEAAVDAARKAENERGEGQS